VAITTNSASVFSATYHWSVWKCGLAYIATIIGAIVSIVGGGWLSDATADWLTKRNNGIREPEMRLPTITISMICCPLSLILYGVGVSSGLHWIAPVLGLGLRKFYLPFYFASQREKEGFIAY
jgi:Mn2+/Fe2+ NRAMP family transporter